MGCAFLYSFLLGSQAPGLAHGLFSFTPGQFLPCLINYAEHNSFALYHCVALFLARYLYAEYLSPHCLRVLSTELE